MGRFTGIIMKGRRVIVPTQRKRGPKTKMSIDASKLGPMLPKVDVVPIFQCTCCGKKYIRQQGNFNASRSPLYNANSGYVTVCRNCVDKLYSHYEGFYGGDECQAMERICQIFDMYFDEKVMDMTGNAKSKVSSYIKGLNTTLSKSKTQEFPNRTYTDTILRRKAKGIQSADPPDEGKIEERIKFWGFGWDEQEYGNLERMYADWVAECGEPADKSAKELYKALCYMQMKMQTATMNGEGGLSTLIKQFRDTLEDAGLMQEQKEDGSKGSPLGVWIEQIENYTPADFYKDKELYKDHDGIGEYIERFMLRAIRNTFLGTSENDKEFSLGSNATEESQP
jgi:hypothetical protein